MADDRKQKKRIKREKRIIHTKISNAQKGLTETDKKKGKLGLFICFGVVILATVVVMINIK